MIDGSGRQEEHRGDAAPVMMMMMMMMMHDDDDDNIQTESPTYLPTSGVSSSLPLSE